MMCSCRTPGVSRAICTQIRSREISLKFLQEPPTSELLSHSNLRTTKVKSCKEANRNSEKVWIKSWYPVTVHTNWRRIVPNFRKWLCRHPPGAGEKWKRRFPRRSCPDCASCLSLLKMRSTGCSLRLKTEKTEASCHNFVEHQS